MWAYSALLRLFPRAFRERYGAEMTDFFAVRWRAARRTGLAAVMRLLIGTVADLSVHSVAERRRGRRLTDRLVQDTRFAIRSFARRPGVTAVALSTIALGIGANTAIFSVVRPLLLDRLPFPHADRIVSVYEISRDDPGSRSVVSPANFDAWERRQDIFDALAGYSGRSVTLTGAGDPERLQITTTTPSFFGVFGTHPMLGRTFSEAEAASDAPVIVLSDGLWRTKLGADPQVLERGVTLDGRRWQVLGVMPPGFAVPTQAAAWVPLSLTPAIRANHDTSFLAVAGRLAPGVAIETATAALDFSMAQLGAAFPRFNVGRSAIALGWHDDEVSDVRPGLWMLQGVAVIVLLIACANLTNLLFAQAAGRSREFAIRAAIGAGRGQLVRQLLTEGVMLAVAGSLLGVALAVWSVPAIAALAPSQLPHAKELAVHVPDLAAALMLAAATGVLFSVFPALAATRQAAFANASARGSTASRKQREARSILVAAQVALALVLLAGAGLLVKSFARLTAQPIGFAPDHVLTAALSLPAPTYDTDDKRRRLFSAFVDGLASQPGVVSATASTALPFTWWEWMDNFEVIGRPGLTHVGAAFRMITPAYLETLHIPLLEGRALSPSDTASAPRVAIVNERFAKKYAALGEVIGVTLRKDDGDHTPITIVGIVGDTRHRSFERPAQAELYLPLAQWGPATMTIAVRTVASPTPFAPVIRRVLFGLDRNLPLSEVQTLDTWVGAAVAEQRFYMVLLTIFAGLAAVLALVGIYGVTSYVVGLRRREIGIRIAIGATSSGVQRLMLRQGMMPVVVGAVFGMASTVAATRLLRDQLFQIGPRDPTTLIGVAAVFMLAGAAACWIPSRRTSRVDPVEVLLGES
jgi:putative ABC transport system permease protein